jgi:hypothetical protein
MIKLLVDVFTPGNGKTYEFLLDGAMTVDQAKEQIIASVLAAEQGGVMLDISSALLGDVSAGQLISGGTPLYTAGVRSGHRMVLM